MRKAEHLAVLGTAHCRERHVDDDLAVFEQRDEAWVCRHRPRHATARLAVGYAAL
jgi:hypothetical protein